MHAIMRFRSRLLFSSPSLPLRQILALLVSGALCVPALAQKAGEAAAEPGADPIEGLIQEAIEVTPPAPVELGPVPSRERRHYGLKLADSARSQIGTPYRLGRSKPGQGFDCSGLVWWVYRQHGIELPRVSVQQALVGESVPLSEAHPGDIVVFKTGRGPNGFHTGIITDTGHFIHAPSTGKRVQETAIKGYWSNKLHSVRRVHGLKLTEPLPSADEINLALDAMPEGAASSEGPDPLFATVSGASQAAPRLGSASGKDGDEAELPPVRSTVRHAARAQSQLAEDDTAPHHASGKKRGRVTADAKHSGKQRVKHVAQRSGKAAPKKADTEKPSGSARSTKASGTAKASRSSKGGTSTQKKPSGKARG